MNDEHLADLNRLANGTSANLFHVKLEQLSEPLWPKKAAKALIAALAKAGELLSMFVPVRHALNGLCGLYAPV